MTLAQHLIELRKRLMIASAALVLGMILAFFVTGPLIDVLSIPILNVASQEGRQYTALNFDTVTGGFDLRIRIAFAVGLLLSAPIWLWQIWAFVMPGLTRKEVRYTIAFLAAAIPLFFGGCAVGFLVIPHVIELMATFVPAGMAQFYKYDVYYDLVFKLLIVIGVAFVLPVFLVGLNVAGIMSGKAILKGWRVAILTATVFAALATPAADVTSMLMLAGILMVLYVAAAGVSLLFDRRRARRQAVLVPAEPAR